MRNKADGWRTGQGRSLQLPILALVRVRLQTAHPAVAVISSYTCRPIEWQITRYGATAEVIGICLHPEDAEKHLVWLQHIS